MRGGERENMVCVLWPNPNTHLVSPKPPFYRLVYIGRGIPNVSGIGGVGQSGRATQPLEHSVFQKQTENQKLKMSQWLPSGLQK